MISVKSNAPATASSYTGASCGTVDNKLVLRAFGASDATRIGLNEVVLSNRRPHFSTPVSADTCNSPEVSSRSMNLLESGLVSSGENMSAYVPTQ